jgi:hypothetical protein
VCGEVIFWKEAVDKETASVKDEFSCPNCLSMLNKRNLEKSWITKYDHFIQDTVRFAKQVPVVINYSAGRKRFQKEVTLKDIELIEKIESENSPYWFPTARLFEGKETRRNDSIGVTHVHHFFTNRNILSAAKFYSECREKRFLSLLTGVMSDISRMGRVKIGYYFKGGGGPFIPGLAGTLYIPSLAVEKRVNFALENRLANFVRSIVFAKSRNSYIGSTGSMNSMSAFPDNSADYLFFDPPFGANLSYSELNVLWEEWLKRK